MASTSETGHPINVANFEDLISRCIGYGISYQPTKAALQIPALQALRLTAQGNLTAVNSAIVILINSINARQIAFDPIKPLATRIVNALDATDASDELVKDAQTLNRKIQGKRKGETKPPTTPPTLCHQFHPFHLQEQTLFPTCSTNTDNKFQFLSRATTVYWKTSTNSFYSLLPSLLIHLTKLTCK
jgi:hypothetical protein